MQGSVPKREFILKPEGRGKDWQRGYCISRAPGTCLGSLGLAQSHEQEHWVEQIQSWFHAAATQDFLVL